MSTLFRLKDEAQTRHFGALLAAYRPSQAMIYLDGDLGAGKTTLSRGFIHACGHIGQVKSPTYTLMETYPLQDVTVHHLDLYRLSDPEELEYLGVDELDRPDSVVLVEWPQRGLGVLPPASLTLQFHPIPEGRELTAVPHNPAAEQWIAHVDAHFIE